MKRFSHLTEYELLDLQDKIKDIIRLKHNDYFKDLDDEEIEEIKHLKKLFEKINNDFQNLEI